MATRPTIRRYVPQGVNYAANMDAENPGSLICRNFLPSLLGGVESRKGFKAIFQVSTVWDPDSILPMTVGMTQYHATDLQASTQTDELLIACYTANNGSSGGLVRIKRYNFVLTNSDVSSYTVNHYCNSSGQWTFEILNAGGVVIFTSDLGSFWGTPKTFSTLASELSSATIGLTFTLPSGFSTSDSVCILPIFRSVAVSGSGGTANIEAHSQTSVPTPVSEGPTASASGGCLRDALSNSYWGAKRIFHAVQFQNRLWFRDVWNLRKYDGKNAIAAGLKAPVQASLAATTGSGSVANGDYRYLVTFSSKDAQGYEFESDGYETTTVTMSGGPGYVTLSNLQGKTGWQHDGFNSHGWKADGWGAVCSSSMGSPGTAVTCGTYLKLDIGDPVYLYDRATSAYVERYVTNVSGTTLTLNSNVQLNSGDAVSPIRINIYRSKVGPSTLYYHVATVPVNVSASTQSYDDALADTSLGTTYTAPLVEHTPPPSTTSSFVPATEDEIGSAPIEMFQGSLVLGGVYQNQGVCRFSDVNNPEAWPEDFQFVVGEGAETVTGLKSMQEYMHVFTGHTSHVVTGALASGDFRVDVISRNVGCASHASIADCAGVVYWCADNGIYRSSRGQEPELVSQPIQALWEPTGQPYNDVTRTDRLRFERAVGWYDRVKNQYRCFVPSLIAGSGSLTPSTAGLIHNSKITGLLATRVLCFDIATGQWFELSGVDAQFGVQFFDDKMFTLGHGFYTTVGNPQPTVLCQRIDRNDSYAYVDDSLNLNGAAPTVCRAISCLYRSRFDSLGMPRVLKKVTRMAIEAYNPNIDNTNVYANFSLTLRAYKDYIISTAYSAKSIFSITGSVNDWWFRLLPRKLRSIAFEVESGTINERAAFTSVSIEAPESYRDAFKERNG